MDDETAATTTGHALLDQVAPVTHFAFYIPVVLMGGTGYARAILAGLNRRRVFQGSGGPLPPSFATYPTFVAHGFPALLVAGSTVLHGLAALYRQLARKDRLLRWMWFGQPALDRPVPMKQFRGLS